MQKSSISLFAYIPSFAHGLVLIIESNHLIANQSTTATHHLDVEDGKQARMGVHASLAKGSEGRPPNATYKLVDLLNMRFRPVEKRQFLANQPAKGIHRLAIQDVKKTRTQDHASLANYLQWHHPDAACMLMALKVRIRSIIAVSGSMIVVLVICLCIVLICVSMVDDQQGDGDPPLVGRTGSALALMSQKLRQLEET